MKRNTIAHCLLAAAAFHGVTAYSQVLNPSFENGLSNFSVTGSNTVVQIPLPPAPIFTQPPGTIPGLGIASTTANFNGITAPNGGSFAVISNGTFPDPLTTTRITQTIHLPALVTKFKGSGRLVPVAFNGFKLPNAQLSFNYRFLTNEIFTGGVPPTGFNDSFQATLSGLNAPLARIDRNDLLANGFTAGLGGFDGGSAWLTSTTDVTALLGKTADLSFVVWDVDDTFGDSVALIDNIQFFLPTFVVQDVDAIFSIEASGLPMALAQRQALLGISSTMTQDINGRLFRLRSHVNQPEPMPQTYAKGPSDGKHSKEMMPPPSPSEKLWEFFAGGNYGYRDLDQTSSSSIGFDTDTYSGTVGAEYRVSPNLIVGAAFTYLESDSRLGGGIGSIDIDGFAFTGYASYFQDNFYADLLYSFGLFDQNIRRDTLVGKTATADPDSYTNTVVFNAGYNLNYDGIVTGPIASLGYVNGNVDGYTETGASFANTRVPEQSVDSLISNIGWQASLPIRTTFGSFTPQVRASWAHEYLNDSRRVDVSLVNSPYYLVQGSKVSSIGSYSTSGETGNPGRDYLVLGGGVRYDVNDSFTLLFDFDSHLFQADNVVYTGSITGSWKF